MDAIHHWPWWCLWLATVAAGAAAGGLYEAVHCLIDRARGRQL